MESAERRMARVVYGSAARSSLVMARFIYGEKLTDNLGYYEHRRPRDDGMSMIMLMMMTMVMLMMMTLMMTLMISFDRKAP